jgi:hypothetical protein
MPGGRGTGVAMQEQQRGTARWAAPNAEHGLSDIDPLVREALEHHSSLAPELLCCRACRLLRGGGRVLDGGGSLLPSAL